MKTSLVRLPASAAAVVVMLAGCASSGYHFSQLEGRRFFKTNIDTYAVIISRVDGDSTPLNQPVLVNPGMRTVEVQGPPTPTSNGELRSITFDVKPCSRYYLVAVKASPL